ncbi:MAG TPA: transporter associated domain-containing protein, partial [Phycisphaerales bacterium]|nr:transporter associated domain-containing protein [Phycisphaerales bacterium]
IRLSGLRVKDVMTHRVDMQWVDERTTHAEIVALVRSKRVTRLPVVKAGEDIDQGVVGLLDVKRYLAGAATTGREREWRVTDALDPVRYVPASASLDKLLEQFSSAGVKLGLVVDEHGAVVGIVTTENIVQRLIAELTSDEELEIEAQVSHLSDGRWSVPGRLSVRDWASMFGLSGGTLEARVSTVGGLIFAKLGRVPRVGDVVTIGNLRLEVLAMHGRVVGAAAVSLEGKSGRGVEGVAASQARAAGGEPGAAGGEEAKGAP